MRVFWKTRGRRAQTIHGDSLLLLGPCGSGKTSFFYLATQDEVPETVTSLKENVASFTCAAELDSKRAAGKLVDFPGHPSVRNQLEKYFPHAAGIVFMVDGSGYEVKEVAEFLYDIFVNPRFVSHPCPLLIAVNKSDLPGCADNQTVVGQIESELDLIKESRGSVETVGERAGNRLGVEGQKFSFQKDAPCKVYACNCSVKNRDVQKVTGFITASFHSSVCSKPLSHDTAARHPPLLPLLIPPAHWLRHASLRLARDRALRAMGSPERLLLLLTLSNSESGSDPNCGLRGHEPRFPLSTAAK